MNTIQKQKRSEFIRFRLSRKERQIINIINQIDSTTISEHVRRSLLHYAKVHHPTLLEKATN
jgi:hypothetical protein